MSYVNAIHGARAGSPRAWPPESCKDEETKVKVRDGRSVPRSRSGETEGRGLRSAAVRESGAEGAGQLTSACSWKEAMRLTAPDAAAQTVTKDSYQSWFSQRDHLSLYFHAFPFPFFYFKKNSPRFFSFLLQPLGLEMPQNANYDREKHILTILISSSSLLPSLLPGFLLSHAWLPTRETLHKFESRNIGYLIK